jgi:hypothetical protein
VLIDIVRLNVARYRTNPVIIVPPLIVLVFGTAITPLMGLPGADFSTPEFVSYAFLGFWALFLSLAISFLTLIGQASMASRVVLEGKAVLRDWVHGVKRYSTKVLGVCVIYLGVLVLSFIPMMIMYWYVMLAQLPSLMGAYDPEMPPSPPIIPPSINIVTNWTALIFTSVITAVLYLWLAPVFFEDGGVFTSIRAGNQALKKNWRTFLGFVALFITVSGAANLIENLPTYLGTSIQRSGYLALTHVTSNVINTIFSPLWFLIALTIYRELPR